MPSFWEELFNPTLRGGGGLSGFDGSPGMLSHMSSPAIPPEWQPDLAPRIKGRPTEIDFSQGIPTPFGPVPSIKGGTADPTATELWNEDEKKFRERNPIPLTAMPQMQAQPPIPGLLGPQISAVPPGVGGNPSSAHPAPPEVAALPPPVTVGPGTVGAPASPGDGSGTDISAARRSGVGAPSGAYPVAPNVDVPGAPAAPPQERNFLQRFDDMTRKNSGLLLALAAGFAGAPSFGTGMSRAFGNAAPFAESGSRREEQQQLVNQQANLTARALASRGASPEDIAAAVRNPELMKALVGKYFSPKDVMNVNGRLVRMRPDGSPELLADYSKDPAPKFEEFSTPQGKVKMQVMPDGSLKAVPGFENPVLDEKDKRRLNVTDTMKLQEAGGKLQQVANFSKTFRDDFGGFVSNRIGEASNAAGRYLPEWFAGADRAKSAEWWQHYDRYKNVVRNELFGSALTAQEKAAFDAADIRPGMTPSQIKSNLEYQRKVVSNGVLRAGQALIEQGYEPKAIAKAYGVSPDFFSRNAEELASSGPTGSVTVGGKKLNWSVVP